MTVRIYVRHDVTDYAAWRKAYDAFDAKRRKMGVTGQAVYRSIDDANDVINPKTGKRRSLRAIAADLALQGYFGPSGSPYHAGSIRQMLSA